MRCDRCIEDGAFTRLARPKPDLAIAAGGGDASAIGAERHTFDGVVERHVGDDAAVFLQGEGFPPGLRMKRNRDASISELISRRTRPEPEKMPCTCRGMVTARTSTNAIMRADKSQFIRQL
jgi:hypothetical protein